MLCCEKEESLVFCNTILFAIAQATISRGATDIKNKVTFY